jgi:hypothetical protein
MYHQYL